MKALCSHLSKLASQVHYRIFDYAMHATFGGIHVETLFGFVLPRTLVPDLHYRSGYIRGLAADVSHQTTHSYSIIKHHTLFITLYFELRQLSHHSAAQNAILHPPQGPRDRLGPFPRRRSRPKCDPLASHQVTS